MSARPSTRFSTPGRSRRGAVLRRLPDAPPRRLAPGPAQALALAAVAARDCALVRARLRYSVGLSGRRRSAPAALRASTAPDTRLGVRRRRAARARSHRCCPADPVAVPTASSRRRAWPGSCVGAAPDRRPRRRVLGARPRCSCRRRLRTARGGLAARQPGRRAGSPRRPLVWIGDLSYSWYLWHWPLIVFAGRSGPAGRMPPSRPRPSRSLPAWLSYRFVENPIRVRPADQGRLRRWRWSQRCIAIPATRLCRLALTQPRLAQRSAIRSWQRIERRHADGPARLQRRDAARSPRRPCSWRVAGARGEVVLIGDSNAGHFTEPFVRAAKPAAFDRDGRDLSSCPFVDLRVQPGISGRSTRPVATSSAERWRHSWRAGRAS